MIVELAIGTGIPVRSWWEEPDQVIATALEVLEDLEQEAKRRAEQMRGG